MYEGPITYRTMKVLVALFALPLLTVAGREYPFCSVPQWEGLQGVSGGVWQNGAFEWLKGMNMVYYDANSTRIAVNSSASLGHLLISVDYLFDYPQKTLYTMETGGKCTKSPLGKSFKEYCVPDGYEIDWVKSWIGMNPSDTLGVLGFKGQFKTLDYFMTLAISPRTPIFAQINGEVNGMYVFQTTGFMNLTTGIKDPSIFTPPSDCTIGPSPRTPEENLMLLALFNL